MRVNPNFLFDFVGVHLVRLCMVYKSVHNQRIISNVVLLLSLSPGLMINELHRWPPKSLFNDLLHYSDVGAEPRLTLSMFSCLF